MTMTHRTDMARGGGRGHVVGRTPRVTRHGINAKERDQIVDELILRPWAIAEIAAAFRRSSTTIDKIRQKAGIGRPVC